MAETPRVPAPSSPLLQAGVALVCLVLGLLTSIVIFGPPQPLGVSRDQHPMSCDDVVAAAKLPSQFDLFMGTKLPYQFVGVVNNETTTLNGCTVDKLYGVVRHGARYPTLSHLNKWAELIERLQACPVSTVLGAELVEWVSNVPMGVAAQMTAHGLREQYCLARRFLTRYPVLLGEPYSEEYYTLSTTSLARTVQSSLAFARGLFDQTGPVWGYQPVNLHSVDKDRDSMLRFFDWPCPKYDEATTNNESLHHMLASFLATDEVSGMVGRVREVFSCDWISVDDVKAFFKLCVHELSLYGQSRWCDLFSTDDLRTFGYYSDMRAYWFKGPGFTVTGQRGVYLLQDIMNFLREDKGQKVVWRFAHAETLLPLLSLVGVANSKLHLLNSNNKELLEGRPFLTSDLTPFSGNLVFVKYNCGERGRVVRVLLNEEPIRLEICNRDEFCQLNKLVEGASDLTGGWRTLDHLCT